MWSSFPPRDQETEYVQQERTAIQQESGFTKVDMTDLPF